MTVKLHRYSGKEVEVTYDVRRCIHAAECVKGLPQVFDPKARPWVTPDEASAQEVFAVVSACPTGALQAKLSREDGPFDTRHTLVEELGVEELGEGETGAVGNQVNLMTNGPVTVRGHLRVIAAEGESVDSRVAFCRCGASESKPYCDGSHTKAGFEDRGELGKIRVRGEAGGRGELEVKVAADGPLLLAGPFQLEAADGATCGGEGMALCRCGASENKPFCDGSHTGIEFQGAGFNRTGSGA